MSDENPKQIPSDDLEAMAEKLAADMGVPFHKAYAAVVLRRAIETMGIATVNIAPDTPEHLKISIRPKGALIVVMP